MPAAVLWPLIAGGAGFAGLGIGYAADKSTRLVNAVTLAGVVYVGGKVMRVW